MKVEDYNYNIGPNNYDEVAKLKEDNRRLKATVALLEEEIRRTRQNPLMQADVLDVDDKNIQALVKIANGTIFQVNISKDCPKIAINDSVLVEQKNLTVIKKSTKSDSMNPERFVIIEKPKVSWKDIGGLDDKIKEIKEVVELPLKNPGIFKKVGITPPKGILLYGAPGTGKTMLAKAVANSTNSTFIEIVGSELVQKFIGEGAKLVKEIFQLAKKKAPSIIFIDELDSIASKRIEVGTSGEREVQRTFMQLLAEIDGFKNLDSTKIIGCTNRIDILDPAIIRPGRLDRLIHISLPNEKAREDILKIHTKKMSLDREVKLKEIASLTEGMSGADLRAVCTEAGYFAIRNKRTKVKRDDFIKAINKVKMGESEESSEYLKMFG